MISHYKSFRLDFDCMSCIQGFCLNFVILACQLFLIALVFFLSNPLKHVLDKCVYRRPHPLSSS